jgi:hypothetical protein
MSLLRTLAYFCALAAPFFLFPDRPSVLAAEKAATTVTRKGRVDLAGLDVPQSQFTVRALRPQKRDVELGKTTTDGSGNFQLAVNEEALALYGVVVEVRSASTPALVLETAVLRAREAAAPAVINVSSTVEAALLNWRVQTRGKDLASLRPFVLFDWLRPVSESKTRDGLRRAGAVLVKWAVAAAGPASQTSAGVLLGALGDTREMEPRLAALRVAPAAISQLQALAKKDPEVAYILMMPYFLEL